MQKLCKQCSTMSETDGNFCPTCGASYNAGMAAPTPQAAAPVAAATSTTSSFKTNVNPAFVWTTIAIGVVGVISTFMAYAQDGENSVNGWDSKDVLDYYGKTAGTTWILVFSIAAIVAGLVHFSSLGSKQTPKTQGWSMIVVGALMAWQANATYEAWDYAAKAEEVTVEIGIGLNLAYLVAVALIVVGIICLARPTFHTKSN